MFLKELRAPFQVLMSFHPLEYHFFELLIIEIINKKVNNNSSRNIIRVELI